MASLHCMTIIFCLLAIAPHSGSNGERYVITRRASRPTMYDIFQLPASRCSRSSPCAAYGGFWHDSTRCQCGCKYEDATFGFYERIWTCIRNEVTRKMADCAYKLKADFATYPPPILTENSTKLAVLITDTCKIGLNTSKYLMCDGTWKTIERAQVQQAFALAFKRDLTSNHAEYTLHVESNSLPGHVMGRIIQLSVTCSSLSKSPCIMFKLEGTISCPLQSTVNVFTASTSEPSQRFTRPSQSGTESTSPVVQLPNPRGEVDEETKGELSPAVVATVVIIVILLVFVVAVVGFVIWKKKRGEEVKFVDRFSALVTKLRSPTKKQETELADEESVYEEVTEQDTNATSGNRENWRMSFTDNQEEEMYNFAFDDPRTVEEVQSIDDSIYEEVTVIRPSKKSIRGGVQAKMANPEAGMYDEPEASHYNVLEEPEADEPEEISQGHRQQAGADGNTLLSIGTAEGTSSNGAENTAQQSEVSDDKVCGSAVVKKRSVTLSNAGEVDDFEQRNTARTRISEANSTKETANLNNRRRNKAETIVELSDTSTDKNTNNSRRKTVSIYEELKQNARPSSEYQPLEVTKRH